MKWWVIKVNLGKWQCNLSRVWLASLKKKMIRFHWVIECTSTKLIRICPHFYFNIYNVAFQVHDIFLYFDNHLPGEMSTLQGVNWDGALFSFCKLDWAFRERNLLLFNDVVVRITFLQLSVSGIRCWYCWWLFAYDVFFVPFVFLL